jgi:hypothetical protein
MDRNIVVVLGKPFPKPVFTPITVQQVEPPFSEVNTIEQAEPKGDAPQTRNQPPAMVTPDFFPLRLKQESDTEWFQFPLEPLISVKGKNLIVKRYVAKSGKRGSVKEFWAQDDYDIEIRAVLQHPTSYTEYPEELLRKLRTICESGESIEVQCDLLLMYDISRIVIEDLDFPFTKGENAQLCTLKCVSDDSYDLLIEDPTYALQ